METHDHHASESDHCTVEIQFNLSCLATDLIEETLKYPTVSGRFNELAFPAGETQYMHDSKNIDKNHWQLPAISDEHSFQQEEERFSQLVKEIEEMAGVITSLAKANGRFR